MTLQKVYQQHQSDCAEDDNSSLTRIHAATKKDPRVSIDLQKIHLIVITLYYFPNGRPFLAVTLFVCRAARQRRYQEEQPAFFPLCMRISLRNTTPFPIWRKRGAIVLLCKKSFLDLSICQPHQDVYFIQSRRRRRCCYCRSRVKVQALLRLNKETRCAHCTMRIKKKPFKYLNPFHYIKQNLVE